MRTLYKNIRFRRLKLKMSQDLLAELTGYSDGAAIAKIEKGEPVDVKEVEFVSPDTMRDKLYAKITEMPSSINHFADLCGIYPSHLHEFLKGTKNLGRDKLIIVCIVLKLNLRETREVLKCTLQSDFYPKNQRDFIIMSGIKAHRSVDDINELLMNNGLSILS